MGDERDGTTPPITFENFIDESSRYAAKAYRDHLSKLSYVELLHECVAAFRHLEARQEQLSQIQKRAEQFEQEEAEQALSQRQSELGHRSRQQPEIAKSPERAPRKRGWRSSTSLMRQTMEV
jgi:hypothetical protein